jgi:hypothetical protein
VTRQYLAAWRLCQKPNFFQVILTLSPKGAKRKKLERK